MVHSPIQTPPQLCSSGGQAGEKRICLFNISHSHCWQLSFYPPVKTKMHPYPESKARQKSTCDGSIDACEVRCIQGVLSQSKNLKNIKINKWTENKLIEVMSEGYSRNDEKNTTSSSYLLIAGPSKTSWGTRCERSSTGWLCPGVATREGWNDVRRLRILDETMQTQIELWHQFQQDRQWSCYRRPPVSM